MGEWQPIETAPMREKIIVARVCGWEKPTISIGLQRVYYDVDNENPMWSLNGKRIYGDKDKPTHWQPLPKPPYA